MNNLNEISDSDSDHEVLQPIIFRRQRTIRQSPIFFDVYDYDDFRKRFRLTKEAALFIYSHIKDSLYHSSRKNAIKPHEMFLFTPSFYATASFQKTVGDIFHVSKSTVSRAVTTVTRLIAALRPQFVNFPTTDAERLHTQEDFRKVSSFPRVIAAIDCTHIKIISPGGEDAEVFRNRKGFFSFNVQTLCDSQLRIMDIVARWPGSTHDSRIFKNSRIYGRLHNREFKNVVVVADSGYENTNVVLTPLLTCNTAAEALYNEAHIRTRNCVARSYGVWKRRFPILSMGIRMKTEKVPAIIVATAVLHNVCCLYKDMNAAELPSSINDAIRENSRVPNNRSNESRSLNNSTRRTLIDTHFANLLRKLQ